MHLDQVLVVGDRKLSTRDNVLGCCRVQARCIGPTSLTDADRRTLATAWAAGEPWPRLDPPAPDAPPRPGRSWGLARPEPLPDPERGTSSARRRLFVHSLDDRPAARHQRAKDLARARRALWTIGHRLRHPAYRDAAFVARKVAAAVAKVAASLHTAVVQTPTGLDVRWRLDHQRLREDASFDGRYCLLTNAAPAADRVAIFRASKDQRQVEGRCRAVKQPPIQLRPLWLHQPRRLERLIVVMLVALFVFAPIEREARRVVQESGQDFTGVRAEGRDQLPIATTCLVDVFAPLAVVKQRLRVGTAVVDVVTPTTLSPPQAQVLDRLGLPHPACYLQTTTAASPP